MILQNEIAKVIDSQKLAFSQKEHLFLRETLNDIPIINSHVTIITGIRRCGKSTLLLQLLHKHFNEALYLNFEDIRLVNFDSTDFSRLYDELERRQIKVLFFDEIQLIPKWEIFVNQLNREGFQIFITGSNASLLSKELGTHLTGRHLSFELFPFSYQEFISFKKLNNDEYSLVSYLNMGGFPEYVKTQQGTILNHLVDDILIRDIAVRYALRDITSLRQLMIYLITNIGNLVSANKLVGMFGIKSATTFLDYFSYLKDSYLIEFLPQFNYSIKNQNRRPKKIYTIDTGFISEIAAAFTENLGHKLENLIYLHLRRQSQEIYFYQEKGECDFVLFKNGKIKQLIQVCYQLNDINFNREVNGLHEAMNFFNLKTGYIITSNQTDQIIKDGKTIRIMPAHHFIIGQHDE